MYLNQELQEIMNCKKNTSTLALVGHYRLWVLITCEMDTQELLTNSWGNSYTILL